MFSISDISYYIGGRALYEKASLFIQPNEKIGLIGLNGKGKSTLLRIINGEYQLDEGTLSKAKNCTVGFLNQDLLSYQTQESILSVAMSAFKEAVNIQTEIDHLLHQLESQYTEDKVNRLTELQEKFENLDGYTLQAKAEELLEGIGFSTADLQRPLQEFSGGWRMRVILAKLLLEKPSLLMLDEPTNHLDLPSIEWIEGYLRNYPGAIIVVSHDRHFLDRVTSKTVEVTNQQLITYEGNYSFYLKEKELRDNIQQNAYENQQKSIKQTERFIERFRAKSTKAKQVQSRIKTLERMDRISELAQDNAEINFKFAFSKSSGKQVITLAETSKAYGAISIFENTNATIERGDKIALIGANGKGKSTLLRILAGSEPIDSGKRSVGYNVATGFYAQHQLEALQLENEVLDELKQAGSKKTEQELRNVLGCFLFSDEDVFKKIKVLSGGEKSRVALAKTLISEANFLILDEPTNHLDFMSENILIKALQQYTGSFITVSHNRHFIDQIATKIWYIENQKIKEYPGRYEEYEHKQSLSINANSSPDQQGKHQTVASKNATKNAPKSTSKKEIDLKKELKKMHNALKHVEHKLEQMQKKKTEIEEEMTLSEIYRNIKKLTRAKKDLSKVEASIQKSFHEWELLAEKIDHISIKK